MHVSTRVGVAALVEIAVHLLDKVERTVLELKVRILESRKPGIYFRFHAGKRATIVIHALIREERIYAAITGSPEFMNLRPGVKHVYAKRHVKPFGSFYIATIFEREGIGIFILNPHIVGGIVKDEARADKLPLRAQGKVVLLEHLRAVVNFLIFLPVVITAPFVKRRIEFVVAYGSRIIREHLTHHR